MIIKINNYFNSISTIKYFGISLSAIKDKEIKELHKKINLRNVINQFKMDKEKYMVFLDEPKIIISIAGWSVINVMILISTIFT